MQNQYNWHNERYCQICGNLGAYDVEGNYICDMCYEAYKELEKEDE